MSRFKIFASIVPLILAGVFARESLTPQPQPCIRVGNISVQMATLPWQSQSRVSFTDDPAQATVRVQIVESPDNADFTVVDDIGGAEPNACAAQAATRYIGIAKAAAALQPIIYLSNEPGDFRIFVQSKTFSPQAAAALVVGADGDHTRVAAAAL
ncbi:MAG: hypothetical protein J0H71_04765 [Rhizobiales bacterium]|nr:hypothetical protein [Hyphomicrobiales bacterium]